MSAKRFRNRGFAGIIQAGHSWLLLGQLCWGW